MDGDRLSNEERVVGDRSSKNSGNMHKRNDEEKPWTLYNSDKPGMDLVTFSLTGKNFLAWSTTIKNSLEVKGKLCFLDESMKPTNSEDLWRWKKADSMVKAWVTNSLTEELKEQLVYCSITKILWQELEERFGSSCGPLIYQIQRDLAATQQGYDSVTTYYGKTANKHSEFLMGLNKVYENIKGYILNLDTLPTVNKALAMITTMEQQQEVLMTCGGVNPIEIATIVAKGGRSDGDVKNYKRKEDKKLEKCTHYQMNDHLKETCGDKSHDWSNMLLMLEKMTKAVKGKAEEHVNFVHFAGTSTEFAVHLPNGGSITVKMHGTFEINDGLRLEKDRKSKKLLAKGEVKENLYVLKSFNFAESSLFSSPKYDSCTQNDIDTEVPSFLTEQIFFDDEMIVDAKVDNVEKLTEGIDNNGADPVTELVGEEDEAVLDDNPEGFNEEIAVIDDAEPVAVPEPVAKGLMLLWVDHKSVNIRTLTIALGLIALGKAVKEPTTSDFLEYQLSEKVKKKGARATRVRGTENNINGDDEDQELSQRKERILVENSTTFWVRSASFFGAFYAVSPSTLRDYWLDSFKISALFMGAMHILFYSGIFCYHPEGKPLGSPFTTFYKVFKAAFKRRSLEYPRLEHGNDSNNISVDQFHTSNDPNINNVPFYIEGEEVHLSPRLTLFTFLDKAAIINGNPSDLCTIEQVREVKRFCPVVAMSSIFWAYTLVVASGNTYFVEQSNHLQTVKGGREIPISFFFILKALTCDVVIFLVGKFGLWMTPIRRRIGVGMFCAVLCCITAWQVELHRLTLIKEERVLEQKDPNKVTISLGILILTPQYILLGLMEGLAEHGLEEFFQNHLSESMKKFGDSLTKVVMGIGKLSNVVFVLILHGWFKESIDTSNMDRHIRSDINVTGGDDVPQRPLENDVAQAVVQGQEKPDDDDDASERRTITS
ncbi:protein NRT1/ PTR FAMILY 5.6-like [Senna tora]|uniref:Protein NRT1/ PTR FAMILY 5.6-like n=1 Tax=Senna tora TaxID=362788 RepID=A0A834TRD1_9FABA|nr:protein NRT1/ PTR FAMILY 5.6-like [Senna tora]